MNSLVGNKAFQLIAPFLALILAYIAVPYATGLPAVLTEKLPLTPYLVFGASVFLGALYGHHRVALMATLLGMAYWGLNNFAAPAPLIYQNQEARLVYAVIGALLPISIILSANMKARRIFSTQAVITFAILITLGLSSAWLIKHNPSVVNLVLLNEFYTNQGFIAKTPIPQLVLIIYAFTGAFMLLTLLNQKTIFDACFLAALVSSLLALQTGMSNPDASIYMSLSGLLLAGSIVLNAYLIAYIDELTELPGRRALNEELSRIRGQYAIAMLDVDHFKKFNDNYGHDVGDQVLRMVASKMRNVGGGGKAFRYGGEEFAVVFPGKTSKSSFEYLSNLRETIDNTHMVLRNKQERPKAKPEILPKKKKPWQEVHVTISIGVAEKTEELRTSEEVIKAADKALYRAKEKGRNRISQYGMELGSNPNTKQQPVA